MSRAAAHSAKTLQCCSNLLFFDNPRLDQNWTQVCSNTNSNVELPYSGGGLSKDVTVMIAPMCVWILNCDSRKYLLLRYLILHFRDLLGAT